MKKIKFPIIALCMLTAFSYSCKNNHTENVENPATEITADKMAQIKSLGFSTNGIIKTNEGYVVEGDILLTEDNLSEISAGTKLNIAETEQYRTTNIVKGIPRVVTISLTNLPQKFSDALNTMISRYNSLGLRLTFQRAAPGTIGNIDISGFYREPEPTGGIVLGQGSFPTSTGQPGNKIQMNTHPKAYGSATVSFITSVLQHEVGHCIGFRHTDYFNRDYSCAYNANTNNEGQGSGGAVLIPGTPSKEDARSFMLACANGDSFNANDIIALKYLYK